MSKSFWGIAAAVALAACQGEAGDPGAAGPTGPAGPAGPSGPSAPGFVALEPAGVVGVVADVGGAAVSGGTVYFVPAGDVAAMPATATAVDSDTDEPLEDLIRLNEATYTKAAVGTDGVYRLATLPAGSYFVTFVPATADHLPGGSLCRVARSAAALVGTRLDIEVSAAIPSDAQFVGSSRCIGCHGRAHISGTMHRLGIWSPYGAGPMQDLDARRDDLYRALDGKFTAAGTTVYFYDYDGTRGFDKYKTSETDPGTGTVSLTVTAFKDGDVYKVRLHSVKNAAVPDLVLDVDAIYGGGVNKQRYLTKVTTPSGFYYMTLPLQFNQEGTDANADRTRKVWRDYHAAKWFNDADGTFKNVNTEAASKDGFEKNCMSCHAAGVQITGSDTAGWKATLIPDPLYGDFDYDGDGVKEELNVGCETCHGPGSRHWEAAGQGKHIVSLKNLTPEREAMVCGQCHSRPTGKLGTDSPVNAAGWMMIAGTSRNEYLKSYAGGGASAKLDAAGGDLWGDAADAWSIGNHSKAHHQQYTDFIRSKLYKNDANLLTCAGCHDPHQKTQSARQLRASPADNAALCGSCHADKAADLEAHLDAQQIFNTATKLAALKCTDCHMPKTAQTGSGKPGASGTSGPYWTNDVSSHVFDVPAAGAITTRMPTAYTNACGSCHGVP